MDDNPHDGVSALIALALIGLAIGLCFLIPWLILR